MNIEIKNTFNELENIRNMYFSSSVFNEDIHHRKVQDKWSVAEVIYHCYLLLRLVRITSQFYLPVARGVRRVGSFKRRLCHNKMTNIYSGETMKSPRILVPSMKRHIQKVNYGICLKKRRKN